MSESRVTPRTVVLALVALTLILPPLTPQPASAVDVLGRGSDIELELREVRRLKGLQVAVEVRFLNLSDDYLERLGVDFAGSVGGAVTKKGNPVEGAKIILEAFKLQAQGNPPTRVMTRTGRQTVETDSDGEFRIPLKQLIDSDTRKAILVGNVESIVIEATGKNGKKMDGVLVRVDVVNGGVIP